MKSVKKMFF